LGLISIADKALGHGVISKDARSIVDIDEFLDARLVLAIVVA
jgi:hypothetical protein